jgi:hypothetical protein
MRYAVLPLAAAALLLSGCGVTGTIHPLYSEKQAAAALPIEGNWTDEKGEDVFKVRKADKGFRVTLVESDKTHDYDLHLVQLGETWFADVAPRDLPDLALPLHVIAKIRLEGDDLLISFLGSEWLLDAVRQAGLPLIETPDRDHVIAARTPELQKFVRGIAGEPRAFDSEAPRLKRIR